MASSGPSLWAGLLHFHLLRLQGYFFLFFFLQLPQSLWRMYVYIRDFIFNKLITMRSWEIEYIPRQMFLQRARTLTFRWNEAKRRHDDSSQDLQQGLHHLKLCAEITQIWNIHLIGENQLLLISKLVVMRAKETPSFSGKKPWADCNFRVAAVCNHCRATEEIITANFGSCFGFCASSHNVVLPNLIRRCKPH